MLKIVLLYLFLNQSGTLLGVYMNWNFFFLGLPNVFSLGPHFRCITAETH
jgi:hypothetical protein